MMIIGHGSRIGERPQFHIGSKSNGKKENSMLVRIFDGMKSSGFISEQHVNADIPGGVRVVIDESADLQEVVTSLLHIANWIDREAALTKHPS
jgi:hypothetical protein